jgi:hypothetical protein
VKKHLDISIIMLIFVALTAAIKNWDKPRLEIYVAVALAGAFSLTATL